MFVPDLVGTREEIVGLLSADAALAEVSELLLGLPYEFERRLRADPARQRHHIAPRLGWQPRVTNSLSRWWRPPGPDWCLVPAGRGPVRTCPAELAGQALGPGEGSVLEREGEVPGGLAAQADCRNEFPVSDQSLDLGP